MDEISKLSQSHSGVGDSVAGNKITNNNYSSSRETSSYMNKLIERFKEEKDSDDSFSDCIDELNHYKSSVGVFLGLEKKLEGTVLQENTFYAASAKERFYKKLLRYEYYESAQEIYAHLLALIDSNFNSYIKPQITVNISIIELNSIINQFIYDPIVDELGENVLRLNKVEIDGMLFFLIGNCHLNIK